MVWPTFYWFSGYSHLKLCLYNCCSHDFEMAEANTHRSMPKNVDYAVGRSYKPHSSESAGNAAKAQHAYFNLSYY